MCAFLIHMNSPVIFFSPYTFHLGAIHTGLIYHDLNETSRVLSDNSNCFGIYEDATVLSCGCKKRNQIPQKSVFSIRHCKRFAVGLNAPLVPPF